MVPAAGFGAYGVVFVRHVEQAGGANFEQSVYAIAGADADA